VKKYSRKNFTLIELLAAMAVFSVLLMVSLRLFNGAQRIWLRSEQKTDTFASGRLAMELIASRMQALLYVNEEDRLEYPFFINEKTVWFASAMATGDGTPRRHFLQFRLVDPASTTFTNAGTLQMIRYSGQNAKGGGNFFGQLFPSYGETKRKRRKINEYSKAMDHVEKVFKAVEEDNQDNPTVDGVETRATAIDICENVIDLKFTRFIADDANSKLDADAKSGDTQKAPYLVEVEIKMLDSRDSFIKWKNAPASEKDEIFLEHGYTFQRAVLLGKKGDE